MNASLIRNFMILLLFYIAYFIMVPTVGYFKDTICNIDIFTTYCDAIPGSTTLAMNFLIYGLVPISAFLYVLFASSDPQQQVYGR
jgi:hypothetical protein